MKKRKKKFLQSLLCLILCIAMIMPSFTTLADGGEAATDPTGDPGNMPVNNPTGCIPLAGKGVIVGLMEVNNTSAAYVSEIDAHNKAESAKTDEAEKDLWSEMGVSVVDNYLNNYPTEFLKDEVTSKGMLILLNRAANGYVRYAHVDGSVSKQSFQHVYSAKDKTAPTDFTGINVVGSTILSNETYYNAFVSHKLDVKTVQGLLNDAQIKQNLDTWRDKFVALWADSSNVDTVLNGMFSKNSEDYYINLLRYLDLLLVVNYAGGSQRWELIANYLDTLNQDGRERFVVIGAISVVRSQMPSKLYAAIPLPVYYSLVTRGSLANYTHFERSGTVANPVKPSDAGTYSYELNPTSYVSDLSGQYNSRRSATSGYQYLWNCRDIMWWRTDSEGYGLALALRPTDLNGKSTGNCGYTFLARREITSTPDIISGGGGSGSTTGNPPPQAPKGQFGIEAYSDDFKVDAGTTVAARIDLDLKQTPELRQTIQQVYKSQLATYGNDKATLKIEYDYQLMQGIESKDEKNFLDVPIFLEGMTATNVKTTGDVHTADVLISGFTWDKMATLLDGNKIISWYDTNIDIRSCRSNRYGAKVSLVFENKVNGVTKTTEIKFEPKGKVLDENDEWRAYDEVPWVVTGDGEYYSNIRGGNYVEIKDDNGKTGTDGPHYDETYEAMAGIPTTEDLYVGFGATEFMLNLKCEEKSDRGSGEAKYRVYSFDKTYDNCIDSTDVYSKDSHDDNCKYYCPGHTLSTSSHQKDGTPRPKVDANGQPVLDASGQPVMETPKVPCSGKSVVVYCGTNDSGETIQSTNSYTITCDCGYTETIGTISTDYQKYKAGSDEHDGHQTTHCLECQHMKSDDTNPSGHTCSHSEGVGCSVKVPDYSNGGKHTCAHPYQQKITGTINQAIDDFTYLKITGAQLWRVNKLKYQYNEDLLSKLSDNGELVIDPETGYAAYYGQGGYVSGNGRLFFDYTLNTDSEKFGNTSKTYDTYTSKIALKSAVSDAHDDFNKTVKDVEITATAVSDFIVLQTTEGLQAPTYNTQVSKTVKLVTSDTPFQSNSVDETIGYGTSNADRVNSIKWDSGRSMATLWTHDEYVKHSDGVSYSASTWTPEHITRSGYNGDYSHPTEKYKNTNVTYDKVDDMAIDDLFKNFKSSNQKLPNIKGTNSSNTDYKKSQANMRMTVTGMNIIDSTTKTVGKKGVWSDSDDLEPVSNGEWETGNCYLNAKNVIWYINGTTNLGGYRWSNQNGNYYQEVGYTKGKEKVNNIVIHNPVSTQDAEILGGADEPDKFVDNRSESSVGEGGDPVSKDNGECPGDATCQYKTLTCPIREATVCKVPTDGKSNDCYTAIGGTYLCDESIYNAHVCPEGNVPEPMKCYQDDYNLDTRLAECVEDSGSVSISSSYGKKHFIRTGSEYSVTVLPGTYFVEIAGAAGGGDDTHVGYPGDIVRGLFTVDKESKIRITLGSKGSILSSGGVINMNDLKYSVGGASRISVGGVIIAVAGGGYGYRSTYKNVDAMNKEYQSAYKTGATKTSLNKLLDAVVYPDNPNDGYARIYRCTDTVISSDEVEVPCGYFDTWVGDFSSSIGMTAVGAPAVDVEGISTCSNCGITERRNMSEHPDLLDRSDWVHKKTVTMKEYEREAITVHVTGLNAHVHDDTCKRTEIKYVRTCINPHHVATAEEKSSWDYSDVRNHDPNSTDCWTACNNDERHKVGSTEIYLPPNTGDNPTHASEYINLDREFKLYYPSTGDFADNPSLWGILDTTSTRGKGYTNDMECELWTRDKFVTFTFDVLDENGKLWKAGTSINVYDIRDLNDSRTYTFYCPLENSEQSFGYAYFNSIATNAPEVEECSENDSYTNKQRYGMKLTAYHTASKYDYIDLVGYIGSLTINDTGDIRFAELFKKPYASTDPEYGWLIPNVVRKVNPKLCNMLVISPDNVRNDKASPQWYHDAYSIAKETGSTKENGTLFIKASGGSGVGKHFANINLPLTPADNPIKSLQNQPMRPGYNLLMDIQTVGNYYGENIVVETEVNEEGGVEVKSSKFIDDDKMVYKMQIIPKYWLLDTSTGKYTGLDVYMGVGGEYSLINDFDNSNNSLSSKNSSFYLYLDWLKESARRNYTANEQETTSLAVNFLSGSDITSRSPQAKPDVLGNAQKIFLNDLNRTFVGGSYTYGDLKNDSDPDNAKAEGYYAMQAQRWHFTLGLPSSAVFVESGKECTTANIKNIKDKSNAVVVCTANFLVRGDVWTLEYDGTGINTVDGGIQLVPGGPKYSPPPTDDPVIVIYSNKYTSKDDLRTEGTH